MKNYFNNFIFKMIDKFNTFLNESLQSKQFLKQKPNNIIQESSEEVKNSNNEDNKIQK
jgi:hypothetical protein